MINRIKKKLRKSTNGGLLHDSRKDCNNLAQICNVLIDKVNELVDKVNELERKVNDERNDSR